MRIVNMFLPVMCAGLLTIVGCSKSETADDTENTATTPTATQSSETGSSTSSDPSIVPASVFVSASSNDAQQLADVKESAKLGDRVTFEARVGGRVEPFVDGRAMFFVTDASLKDCAQLHGDSCKTPWDYCCESKDNLLKHMATVQVVDANGRPMKVSLANTHGLEPLRTVQVTGTVQSIDDVGNMVVNAEAIHVEEG